VTVGGWVSAHGLDVEEHRGVRFVVEARARPDGAGEGVNAEVAVRVARVDRVAHNARVCNNKQNSARLE
jgi:hypothetical protein